MKNIALQELLAKFPDDTEVVINGYETGCNPVLKVTNDSVSTIKNPINDYDGMYKFKDELKSTENHTLKKVILIQTQKH